MSPEDVQRFIRTQPELFEDPAKPWRFVNIAEASRLEGGDILELAERAKRNPAVPADLGSEPPRHHPLAAVVQVPEMRELLQRRGLKPALQRNSQKPRTSPARVSGSPRAW